MTLFRKLCLLFFSFAKIAALVVGGGLAMLPVIEETFVRKMKLISEEELLDITALTQTVPGVIAATASVAVGMKVAGLAGAAAALAGVVTPPFLVIAAIAWLFPALAPDNVYWLGAFAGIRAGVTGLIAVTAFKLVRRTVRNGFEAAALIGFLAAALAGVSPAVVILAAIAIGGGWFYLTLTRMRKAGGDE